MHLKEEGYFMTIRKKMFLIIFILLVAIFLVVFALFSNANNKENAHLATEIYFYNESIKNFTELTVEEINDKLLNEDEFFLYTGRLTCEWCRKLVPILYSVQSNCALTIYYLNSEDTDSNDALRLFREHYGIDTVPSLIYFNGNNHYYNIDLNIRSTKFDDVYLEQVMQNYF